MNYTFQLNVVNSSDAVALSRTLSSIKIDNNNITTSTLMLSDNTFSIKIFNFPTSINQREGEKMILSKIAESNEVKDINILSFQV